jgi:hypothetical protein
MPTRYECPSIVALMWIASWKPPVSTQLVVDGPTSLKASRTQVRWSRSDTDGKSCLGCSCFLQGSKLLHHESIRDEHLENRHRKPRSVVVACSHRRRCQEVLEFWELLGELVSKWQQRRQTICLPTTFDQTHVNVLARTQNAIFLWLIKRFGLVSCSL